MDNPIDEAVEFAITTAPDTTDTTGSVPSTIARDARDLLAEWKGDFFRAGGLPPHPADELPALLASVVRGEPVDVAKVRRVCKSAPLAHLLWFHEEVEARLVPLLGLVFFERYVYRAVTGPFGDVLRERYWCLTAVASEVWTPWPGMSEAAKKALTQWT